jgi:hypothetical protein
MDAHAAQAVASTDWTRIGAIANCVIAVGTFASVLVILASIRAVRRTLQANAYQAIHGMMTNIHITLMRDPEFRRILYGPPLEESPSGQVDPASLETAGEMLIDLFDNIYCQMDVIPAHAFEGFGDYMRGVYNRSDYLQHFLRTHKDWYSSGFLDYIGHGKTR